MDDIKVVFAELLGLSAAVVDKAIEEKNLPQLITEYKVFNTEQYNKLLDNVGKQAIDILKDTKKELPPEIYNRVRGTVLETEENRLKKKFGYSGEHSGFQDLVEKIVSLQVETVKNDSELTKENQRLKDLVKKNDTEWEVKLNEAKQETANYIVSESLTKAISAIPIDAPDDTLEELRTVIINNFKTNNTVKYEGGKIIVLDKNGKPFTDKVGDPLELSEVLKETRPKFVKLKEATGGRATNTQSVKVNGLPGIRTREDFDNYVKEKKLNPAEQQKLVLEVVKLNPDFKY